jgi:hypothetical protein
MPFGIGDAKTIAECVKIVQDVFYAHSDRKKKEHEEEEAKAKRIKELEAEVERLKAEKK